MASFPAQIVLQLLGANKAEQEVKKLERSLDRLDKAAEIALGGLGKAGSAGIGVAKRNVNDYINTLGKLDKRLGGLGRRLGDVAKAFDFGGKTVVGIAGLNALSSALQALPKWAGGANGALQGFASTLDTITAPISVVTDALQAIGPAGVATAGGIAAATAAAMAFGPAIRKAGKQAEDFRKSFTGSFEVSQDIISEKSLRDALRTSVDEQKKLSAGTREYTQKTEEVLALQRELTAELRRQETVLNMVNKAQIDIANNVQKNINASAASRKASGFADFSQQAGAQTAIDKSIRRQREKLARRAGSAPAAAAPLMLPSSEMLNAAERGIKQIRSVTDQLGQDLDYTNQEVANFINGLKTGANEAVKLPPIFNKVAQSLDVINKNFDSAVAKSKRLAGGAAGGTGSTTPIQGRTAALRKLATLEQELITDTARLRDSKDLNSYNTRQRRIKYLADLQEKEDKARAKRNESLLLGVGFPLLFGGGAGSVLGSAAGSFVGDGFGGQIAGGAIGQAIDQYLQSLGELGSALNPATADTQKLVEALGEANSPFNDLIQNLESSGREATALALATQKMVDLVGQDGVNALKEFGADSTRLGNEFAKAMTLMNAGVAELINNVGLFKAIADQLGRANLINQARNSGNADQAARFREFEQAGVGFGNPTEKAAERARIMDEIVQAQIELNAEATREAEIRARLAEFDASKVREIRASVAEKRIELELEQLNAAANDETRIYLEKKLAFQRLMTEQQALYNQFARDQITIDVLRLKLAGARLDYEKQIASIDNAATAANARAAKVGGGGGVDKEAQVQRTIAGLKTRSFELDTKLITIGETKIGKLQIELQRLDQVQALKAAEINLSKEDQRIKDAKLALLSKEYSLLYQQKELQLERLQIEERIADIKARQAGDNLQTQLDQELAGLTLPSGNSFLDEQNALQAEQTNRYANAMRDVNDQIEIQRELATSTDKAISSAAEKRIIQLERQRDIYSTMLPQIAKAEREQLRFNQTLSLVEGPVNAFVNGLTEGLQGIIDGTMSAEEAFANMLKGMADALIQTAAQMIAQYIAIGIAKAFAGMGGGGGIGNGAAAIGQSFGGGASTGASLLGAAFGGRADGGSVAANKPYVVGERGPELFVPSSGGRIVNNADSRAALDRYTPNSSYNYSPNLSITTGPVMQMNNEDYIRREDFERGLRQASDDGAKRGEAMTLRRLKNSRSTRSTLGM